MTISPRRTLAVALATGAAGIAAAALAGGPVAPPGPEVAAPGLCLDLSALGLPSICIDSLLPPGTLG